MFITRRVPVLTQHYRKFDHNIRVSINIDFQSCGRSFKVVLMNIQEKG